MGSQRVGHDWVAFTFTWKVTCCDQCLLSWVYPREQDEFLARIFIPPLGSCKDVEDVKQMGLHPSSWEVAGFGNVLKVSLHLLYGQPTHFQILTGETWRHVSTEDLERRVTVNSLSWQPETRSQMNSTTKGINKLWEMYSYNGTLFMIKGSKLSIRLASRVILTNLFLNKRSQTKKISWFTILFTWNLSTWTRVI